MKKPIKIRIGVLIEQEGKILVTQIERPESTFYVLPGGGMEPEEGIFECARREVREETNLEIEPEKILFLKDHMAEKNHGIEIVISAKIIGGKLKLGTDPDHETQNLKDVKWVEKKELGTLAFHPKQIIPMLQDIPIGGVYLGKHSFPED